MSRPLIVLCAALLASAVAGAQVQAPAQPIQIQQRPATQVAPAPQRATQVAPVAKTSDAGTAIETLESVKAANKQLRENNKLLKAENAALKDKIAAMTSRGGSLVRAYCPTNTTSRNTAGAEADCSASGYTCEDVSGLCRTTCQSTDMCAGGYTCDVGAGRCIYTAGGVPGGG